MGDLSGYEEERILIEWADDNSLYIGLYAVDEGNTPDGSSEVDAFDYEQQRLDLGNVNISRENPTTLINDSDIVITDSADGNWGNVLPRLL